MLAYSSCEARVSEASTSDGVSCFLRLVTPCSRQDSVYEVRLEDSARATTEAEPVRRMLAGLSKNQ